MHKLGRCVWTQRTLEWRELVRAKIKASMFGGRDDEESLMNESGSGNVNE